jgi:hypothetical protein
MNNKKLDKKKLFLIIILSLSLLIFIYLILSSEKKEINRNDVVDFENPKESIKYDTGDYKKEAGRILGEFLEIKEDMINDRAVDSLKYGLLELRVPVEFKKNHLEAVITLDEIKDSFSSENSDIKDKIRKIKDIKNNLDNL